MRAAPTPENEAARLETLRQYQVLDTDSEDAFDDLTRLASYVCQTPTALISLVAFLMAAGLLRPCPRCPSARARWVPF